MAKRNKRRTYGKKTQDCSDSAVVFTNGGLRGLLVHRVAVSSRQVRVKSDVERIQVFTLLDLCNMRTCVHRFKSKHASVSTSDQDISSMRKRIAVSMLPLDVTFASQMVF